MIFADTYYYIALLNNRDNAHVRALTITASLNARLLTTEYVLLEVADAFCSGSNRMKFLRLIDSQSYKRKTTVAHASENLMARGIQLYRDRTDKNWSLTDCLSFLVMRQHNVERALTHDQHFVQAGFKILF